MIHFNSNCILIPVDFSETSLLAIKHGAFLAQLTKGDVHLLHVINRHYESYVVIGQAVTLDLTSKMSNTITAKLSELAAAIKNEYGVNVNCIVAEGNPTSEIIKTAKEVNATLIVMGTHGYSPLEELVIGSNALKVITKSTCPVMAMSEKATKLGYNNILLPIDTSEHTKQKVNYTMELAKHFSAHVHAVGILADDEANKKPAFEVVMNQIKTIAKEKGVNCSAEILIGAKNRAVATINHGQKVKADCIVIMTDQDAELSGFFLGPYSQQVIHLAKVPVIAVKPEEHPENINFSLLSGTSGL
jgi:nucleotide-binding universal stress UspA family protein